MSALTLDHLELRLRSSGTVWTVVGLHLLFETTAFEPRISPSIETGVLS